MTALESTTSMTSTDLTLPSGGPVIPPSADAARLAMTTYQEISKALIDPAKDMQKIGSGEFPKRSAFRKLAKAYRVSTEIIRDQTDYDEDGRMVRVSITVRATSPEGHHEDGDGICRLDERWNGRGEPNPKLEHDTHATAVTRAKNRAISDLVAFGAVSAEEAETGGSGGEPVRAELPAWATPVSDVSGVAQSLVNLFQVVGVDKPDEHAMRIGEAIFKDCDSTIPVGMWQAINHIARALQYDDPAEAAPVDAEATSEPDMTQDTNDAQTGEENYA